MTTGTTIDVAIGLDVGKTAHHACAMLETGEIIYDKPLPQDETELRKVFTDLQQHGTVLVVVDQPNTIGALPIAVARDAGCLVGYLPGLAMRKAADLYPGRSKTDRRDAFIIADTARTMPHTLRAVDRDNEVLSALKMLSGFDDDIAKDATRTINRLRSVLTQIYPSFERALPGDVITRPLVLEMLIHYGGPTKLKKAGYQRVHNWMAKRAKKDPTKLVDAIFAGVMALAIVLFDGFAPDPLSILSLLWVLPLGIAAMLPLGIAVGALVKHPRQLSLLSLLLMGMTVSAGIFYPLSLQNAVLQTIGQWLSLYWLGLGMRSALLPDDIAQVEIDGSWRTIETVFALGAWAVVATLLALYALRRMTHRTAGSRSSLLRRRRHTTRSTPERHTANPQRLNPVRTTATGKMGADE